MSAPTSLSVKQEIARELEQVQVQAWATDVFRLGKPPAGV
jgi:hypothetical protein